VIMQKMVFGIRYLCLKLKQIISIFNRIFKNEPQSLNNIFCKLISNLQQYGNSDRILL